MKNFGPIGLFAVLGMLATSASASIISYNMTTPTSSTEKAGASTSDPYKMSYTYDKAVDLTVTGWSYKSGTDKRIEQVEVGRWEGLGVENAPTPDHAVNNTGGDLDMLLLSFTGMMKLTGLTNAWNQNGYYDSDISILAFTGSSFNNSSLLGKSWDSLLSSGWSVAGNAYNLAEDVSKAVNSTGIYSQYWLVGAYNSAFASTKNDTKDDYFKLGAVTAETKSSSSSSKSNASSVKSSSSVAVSSSSAKSSSSAVSSSKSSASVASSSSSANSTSSSVASSSSVVSSSSSVVSSASSVPSSSSAASESSSSSSVIVSSSSSVVSSAASSQSSTSSVAETSSAPSSSSPSSAASSSVSSAPPPPIEPPYEPPYEPPTVHVPEPGAWLLMLLGLAGLIAARRKTVK